mmetsp:Transcript_99075/g.269177  ORF Transcript_99075/g.269177 Transcript_99075/m.269177 type:complete len:84 (+) Transcript_99075:413-664(+)
MQDRALPPREAVIPADFAGALGILKRVKADASQSALYRRDRQSDPQSPSQHSTNRNGNNTRRQANVKHIPSVEVKNPVSEADK